MTKAELEQIVKKTLAYDIIKDSGSFKDGEESLINCMVEAYNKAIDDSVNRLIFGGDKIANINEDDLAGLIDLKVK